MNENPIRTYTPEERAAFALAKKTSESLTCPMCGFNRNSKEHKRRKCKFKGARNEGR